MSAREHEPRVSVGIPVYNGERHICGALDSLLKQDYGNLDVVISDNASTDLTAEICQAYVSRDSRVQYYRNQCNMGPVRNFRRAFELSSGEFFMWLGHDDSLSQSYISECVQALVSQPDCALACGRPRYFRGTDLVREEATGSLLQDSPAGRLLAYYAEVTDNGAFYGVMRREAVASIPRSRTLGWDWLVIASVAFAGKIRVLDNVHISRQLGGATGDYESTVAQVGLPKYWARRRLFYLRIALAVFGDIAYGSPAYESMGGIQRVFLGCRASSLVWMRFSGLSGRTVVRRLRAQLAVGEGRPADS